MLYYGPEVLDTDDDVEILLLDLVALELVSLDGDGCVEWFLEYLLGNDQSAFTRVGEGELLTARVRHFLGEEGEVNTLIIIGVDVEVFDAGAGVVHKLTQCSGRNRPVVCSQILFEFGPHWWLGIER